VSIVIKKEESPIVVPLHISADEEIKRKESLQDQMSDVPLLPEMP
jgi:hypothetical protein